MNSFHETDFLTGVYWTDGLTDDDADISVCGGDSPVQSRVGVLQCHNENDSLERTVQYVQYSPTVAVQYSLVLCAVQCRF
jgi:hypothetical protein